MQNIRAIIPFAHYRNHLFGFFGIKLNFRHNFLSLKDNMLLIIQITIDYAN